MDTCYEEQLLDIFHNSARLIVAGSSGTGKTELVKKIVNKYVDKFYKIIICGTSTHPIQSLPGIGDKVIVSKDIIDPSHEVESFQKDRGILIIYDDVFLQAACSNTVVDTFTKGRHLGISAILITQNLFMPGKYARSISLNSTHFFLLKMRDLGQIETLGRQLLGREKAKCLLEIYKRAILEKPYSYLLVDLSISTPDSLMFRSNVVDEGPWEVVYTWPQS